MPFADAKKIGEKNMAKLVRVFKKNETEERLKQACETLPADVQKSITSLIMDTAGVQAGVLGIVMSLEYSVYHCLNAVPLGREQMMASIALKQALPKIIRTIVVEEGDAKKIEMIWEIAHS
ncbi:MAG: hypothetical protein WCX97_03605 [Candidatus Magasanikbacteria bacterium]|jgi:hypothetical protein